MSLEGVGPNAVPCTSSWCANLMPGPYSRERRCMKTQHRVNSMWLAIDYVCFLSIPGSNLILMSAALKLHSQNWVWPSSLKNVIWKYVLTNFSLTSHIEGVSFVNPGTQIFQYSRSDDLSGRICYQYGAWSCWIVRVLHSIAAITPRPIWHSLSTHSTNPILHSLLGNRELEPCDR